MRTNFTADFPLLRDRLENGKRLVYLDNAATTQKPAPVIDAVVDYYKKSTANPHRGAYALSAEATELYEGARAKVARFIGTDSPEEIVFTTNATGALNLAAMSWGRANVEPGDEILASVAEHHSNLLPWQAVAKEKGGFVRWLYPDASGRISPEQVEKKLTDRTKIVALTHISNVLGTVNPVAEIAELAHRQGAIVVVDGAQSVPHMPVDVRELGADFLAFSGHKMLAPDGIGVLYGRRELLERMDPLILGGGIVEEVTLDGVRYLDAPLKFEPGTQNVEGAVGLAAAIDYLEAIGMDEILRRERELTRYALEALTGVPGVEVYGDTGDGERTGILSFNVEDFHPHDVASILDADGVTIRAGHHCAQPLMAHLRVASCCRASLYFYNTKEDIDQFARSLAGVKRWLK